MRTIKKGILVILFLLLASVVYGTTYINATLSNNKFGSSSSLDGILTFNFTEALPLSELFVFHVGDLSYPVTLKNVLDVAGILKNLDIIEESYDVDDGGESLNVNGPGIKAGFDLRGNVNNPRDAGDVEVLGVSFNVKPTSTRVEDLKINIGDDRVYRYKGDSQGFLDLDKTHLGIFSLSGSSVDVLSGNVFCQRMNVTDSGEYKAKVIVKKENADSDLNITMSSSAEPFSPDCENPDTPCCTIKNSDILSSSFSEVNCVIKKEIPENTEQYLCAYPTNQDSSNKLFELRVNTNQQNKRGYVSGELSEWDFYLYGQYRTYDRKLDSGKNTFVEFSPDFVNNYINNCERDCLIIPLNITMQNNAPFQLYNLTLKALIDGVVQITEREFKEINIIPESILYDKTVNAELSSLESVLTPDDLDENYEFYVSFDGLNSEKIKFDVVPAPKAIIKYGPFNPGAKEEVNFDASSSASVEGRTISYYVWDFGDEFGLSGIKVKHSYNNSGDYKVKLKIEDSEGIYDIETLTVRVQDVSENLGEQINETLDAIDTFDGGFVSSSLQVKNTVEILGLNTKLNAFRTELNNLYAQYENISLNESLNESKKKGLLLPISHRLGEIRAEVPLRFSVDTSTFDSGVNSLNKIPLCEICGFGTDSLRTKLFVSQKNVNIDGEARIVNLEYLDGNSESFMIIKKDITGSGLSVYEFTPFGFSIEESLNDIDFTVPQQNVYSFSLTNQLLYKVDSTNLGQALQTRTVVLPVNLAGIDVEAKDDIKVEEICGNKICEDNENKTSSCPKDCQPGSGLAVLTSIVVLGLIALIIYFGWFFRGGFLRKLGDSVKNLFKTERDYSVLKNFVGNALNKGVEENKLKGLLRSKGWKEKQIEKALHDIKTDKEKPRK